jgi:hypothetical protein
MFKKFISLEWKQFKRSSYWQKSIILNIFLVLLALYFLVSFLVLGASLFFILKESFPEKDPLIIVNGVLIYWFLFDLIFRYFMQKLPVMNIKPFLNLSIKKTNLTHYLLGKSAFSFFNLLPLFLFVPFGAVLIFKGYSMLPVFAWLLSMMFITLILNYLNFLINRNNKVFIGLILLLLSFLSFDYFGVLDIKIVSSSIFDTIIDMPILVIVPILLFFVTYFTNFKELNSKLFIDGAISKEIKDVKTSDLSWTNQFGDFSTFLKNDMRLIWRNKRPRTVFLLSFLFLFYGMIFFTNDIYKDKETMLVFVSIFITGMFTMNFGQFIPAWDSAYYSMLMSQNIKYRKYLDSKWFLTTVMTIGLYLLSIPYIYFGYKIFLLITVGAVFNIGFSSLFIMFAGAFNRKRIDLDKSAFANYQGTSATQFLMIIPIMVFPMLLFFFMKMFFGFTVGTLSILFVGLVGIVFKNYFMNKIEQMYLKNKYKTISAFNEKA